MTTNYEGTKDGPCIEEHIIVTCSVVGRNLRWTILNTSFEIPSGENTITLSAISDHTGKNFSIPTTSVVLQFYQNETSNSTIESEMHFHLNAGEFVNVSCADVNGNDTARNITALGMYDSDDK